MIENYLKVAWRNLVRNKVYLVINTMGVGIAMACCMSAYLLIAYNLEFDEYFSDQQVKNIVKVKHHVMSSTGRPDQSLVIPFAVAPAARQEIAGIEDYTRYCNDYGIVSRNENAFFENIRFVDLSFFKMFTLGLQSGSNKNFENHESIFLSGKLAKKYFAEKDPIGEPMTVELNGKKYEVVVGGIFEKLPLNISFNIDALMNIDIYMDAHAIDQERWDQNFTSSALFKIADISQRDDIGQQMNKYLKLMNEGQKDYRSVSFELVPFSTLIINGEVSRSNLRLPIPTIALSIFGALGLIILLIACFNLTNTTLALAGRRMKEIGVRKVVGSGRRQIVYQFLLEMLLTISVAILAGVLMAQVMVPQFAQMWQLQYGLEDLNKLNLLLALVVLLFVAAALAGIYPALLNSRMNAIELLKYGRGSKGTNYFIRGLLVLQFSLSIIVFIAGIACSRNISYQNELGFGYDKERILTVSIDGDPYFQRFKNAIVGNSKIEGIAGTANHIGPYTGSRGIIKLDTTLLNVSIYNVGVEYLDVMGLKMSSGRGFLQGSRADYESAVIIDKNFVINHGLANPIDALVVFNDRPYRVIGVAENHLSGLKEDSNSEHLFMLTEPSKYRWMVVRTRHDDILTVRSDLENRWKAVFPGIPFECKLQAEMIHEESNGYNNNLRQILFFITLLGCLLSTSGIYASASLNVQKRTKEIGVRKVLGASVVSIIRLLNREFVVILALAVLLGSVGGRILTNILLDQYTQHIKPDAITILFCSLAVFLIGIFATSSTIFRTASANPTTTLRNE